MTSYTIHEPANAPAERFDRAGSLVFVKDGFSLLAFAVPPIWMIANRLWLVLFIYAVAFAALQITFSLIGAPAGVQSAVGLALNLLVGFEADSLKRWTLERRGYVLVGSVSGENTAVCERRFFEAWLPTIPAVETQKLSAGRPRDPFHDVSTVPSSSNLGSVREPRRGWFGGWKPAR
ncbi:MAG: DUF2628 domain-containing protein [Hyphomicrobiaceae bacterium]